MWLRSLAGESSASDSVAESLARGGVEWTTTEPANENTPGLALIGDCNDAVHSALQQLSDRGRRRVLGIATERATLRAGGAMRLLRAGCTDLLFWDGSERTLERARALLERWREVEELLVSPRVAQNLVGKSAIWLKTLRDVIEVAHFTRASGLILGESGTGKELVARLMHALDRRREKAQLVVLDCTTVVPELSGSEFFGHERGAFTGAVEAREGAFALADAGTLFLDEVGELRQTLQAQLLRVVQEGTYKRVGGNHWHRTDFRLICATNRDLPGEVTAGQFRGDLYHRIASAVFRLPPLRERSEDILPLARHFASELRPGEPPLEFDEPVVEYLLTRAYPGNVRELRQLVTRLVQRHVGPGPLSAGDVPEDERPDGEERAWPDAEFELSVRRALARGLGLKRIGRDAEAAAVRIAIADASGNLQNAASKLGVTDRALQLRRANERQ